MKKSLYLFNVKHVLIFLAASVILLSVCSRSSPLYPLNYWADANCFFTAGKSMMNGVVLYRDIYEQKGPLLYLLHGLAYLISNDSFLGVFLLEVFSLTTFLLIIRSLMLLFTEHVTFLLPIAVGVAIATSKSFALGGSVEELSLPLVSWSLYYMLRCFKANGDDESDAFSLKPIFINGFLAGCILLMKFNLLGFYIGWIVVFLVFRFRKAGYKSVLSTGLSFMAGILLAALPWIIYFVFNKALGDFWHTYFYNNLFLYPMSSGSFTADIVMGIKYLIFALYKNLIYAIPVIIGMFWILFGTGNYISSYGKAGILTSFILLAVGVYIGGRAYDYYLLIFGVYAVFGVIPIQTLINKTTNNCKNLRKKVLSVVITVFWAIFLVFYSYSYANDTYALGADKSSVIHYRFSDIMHELDDNPTLLNYGFMDGGFYTAANIVPNCKYFCTLNIPLNEIQEGQDNCLLSGEVEFVITKNLMLDTNKFNKYDLVCSDTFYGDTLFLYRRY